MRSWWFWSVFCSACRSIVLTSYTHIVCSLKKRWLKVMKSIRRSILWFCREKTSNGFNEDPRRINNSNSMDLRRAIIDQPFRAKKKLLHSIASRYENKQWQKTKVDFYWSLTQIPMKIANLYRIEYFHFWMFLHTSRKNISLLLLFYLFLFI